MDVDRLALDRPLVAEYFHTVDQLHDAVGLVADQTRQRTVVVLDRLFKQLRCAADAGQRILDLVGEHGSIHYEGELAVVIGKKAKHLTEADAMSCVFGYTIGNDVSERTWQKADRGLWRAKNADTFKPMGPWIETDVDLDKMETIIKVNGKETGRFHTNDMIFGIKPFIVELTKYFTLWPGDVIWMGTDGASPDIRDGDVVEIEITGIGTLRNKFVKETAPGSRA